ncbi:cytochrome c oxidase assembly factor 5-like [Convolutriloba macropyga]|uniref:cytochrome c oxidase assembly factor 5-like n=1 Tax=Convolutriloba macropyga TaxID=536237 RepID=UPI003F52167F
MPLSDYFSEDKRKRPPCEGIRTKLKDCLMFSDCYTRDKKSMRECLTAEEGVPDQCRNLAKQLYICKRSVFDPRFRIQGRKDEFIDR